MANLERWGLVCLFERLRSWELAYGERPFCGGSVWNWMGAVNVSTLWDDGRRRN